MKTKATRVMAMVLTVMLCMGAFSMTALAVNDEGSEGAETETPAESSEPLTPDGNLTLVDDTESGDKEFITVQTKAGNTFYLIIDHASDEENVYFLNLVDEEDLLALIDDEDFVSDYQSSKDNTANDSSEVETSLTDESTSQTSAKTELQQEATGGNSGPIAAAVFAAVIIGVAVWFFKFRKPGKSAKNKPDPDDYDYDEDENEGSDPEDEDEAETSDEEMEREDE